MKRFTFLSSILYTYYTIILHVQLLYADIIPALENCIDRKG